MLGPFHLAERSLKQLSCVAALKICFPEASSSKELIRSHPLPNPGTLSGFLLLEKHHVAVMPGESFGQAAAGHLRVGLTVADDILAASIDRIADLYETLVSYAA